MILAIKKTTDNSGTSNKERRLREFSTQREENECGEQDEDKRG